MGKTRNSNDYLVVKPKMEDLNADEGLILTWILNKQDMRLWTGFIWLRIGTSAGSCEHGNER
jgi:hypothetical protein